jgi:hypothetical protein
MMQMRQVLLLIAVLPLSQFASAANSPETNTALGQLQAVAKYCDLVTNGQKIDVKDVLKYLSSGSGNGPCPSCDAMISSAKGASEFKSAYESTMLSLAKIEKGQAKTACRDIQKIK